MRILLFAALTVTAALSSAPARACSTIVAASAGHVIVGRNADAPEIPGLLIVNQRGIAKRALSWGTIGPGPKSQATARWVSRFGSVTVTALGREFPDGGMNERGLVVEEMSLERTRYPSGHGRPTLSQSQWIQYQLDEYESVAQVVNHADDFDITGWGWHFTVADASGSCATIEYLDGKPSITKRANHGGCVLANDTLEHSLTSMTQTGSRKEPQGLSSLARFTRAWTALQTYAPDADHDGAGAFQLLSQINEGGQYTLRWIVHDVSARRLYFRSRKQPAVKYLELNRLDFAPTRPVRILDVDTAAAGDMTGRLVDYDPAANRRVVTTFFAMIVDSSAAAKPIFAADLQRGGMTRAQFIDEIARYPGTTTIGTSTRPR